MLFQKRKYYGLILIFVVLISGLLLMTGSSNKSSDFNDSIFSFRRITLAPLVILASYIAFIYLILKKPSSKNG